MMGRSPRCYIPSFVKIGPLVLEEKILKGFYHIWVFTRCHEQNIVPSTQGALVGSEQYIQPDVWICIVRKSLSLVMTLKMVNAFYLSIQFFGHKQPGKCVLFKFVFHIEHHWAHLDAVFYALNLFFHLQITSFFVLIVV